MADHSRFWVLQRGSARLGDNVPPETYDYELSFGDVETLALGWWGYLICQVKNVHYSHNHVYIGRISDDTRIGRLDVQQSKNEWHTQIFAITPEHWQAARRENKVIFTARNEAGDITGQVDDVFIGDAVIHYYVHG